jgi:hypothetical protein
LLTLFVAGPFQVLRKTRVCDLPDFFGPNIHLGSRKRFTLLKQRLQSVNGQLQIVKPIYSLEEKRP